MENKKQRQGEFPGKYLLIAALVFALSLLAAGGTRFVLRVVAGYSLDEAGLITSMLEGIVASIAAALVIFELRKNKLLEEEQTKIDEARFILEYNQAFIKDENMTFVEARLEKQMEGDAPFVIEDAHRQKFINYLVYLEGLAPLILNKVLRLDHIDNLMAYRFFLAVNNPALQEDQLFRYPEYYLGCFKLYAEWKAYRAAEGLDILQSDTPLDRLFIRPALPWDNRRKIAELLYETDPYIYPAAFGSVENARACFPFYGVFDLNNLYVALKDGIVAGVAAVLSGENERIDPLRCRTERPQLPDSFTTVCTEYLDTLPAANEEDRYILCLSVDPACRRQGVGKALLEHLFGLYPEAAFTLDVLQTNDAAKALYEKMGFVERSRQDGFSLQKQKPAVISMRREPKQTPGA